MASAVATKCITGTSTGVWGTIFPPEQKSQTKSALFVKKLLAIGISNITYLRNLFPERAFGDRSLEDMNLKILRDDTACPGACRVIKWIKASFEAIDKEFLQTLSIGISMEKDAVHEVVESYTYRFDYKDGQVTSDLFRNNQKLTEFGEATKADTMKLLRTIIILTQSMECLPSGHCYLTMKFTYNSNAPEDYEPPGFKPSPHSSYTFKTKPVLIKIGDVQTPYHKIKMRVKADPTVFPMGSQKDNSQEQEPMNDVAQEGQLESVAHNQEEEPVGSDSPNALEQDHKEGEGPETDSRPLDTLETKAMEVEEVPLNSSKAGLLKTAENLPENSGQPNNAVSQDAEFAVNCPCQLNEDNGVMILCEGCNFWQHGVCFSIVDENEAPEVHYCNRCAEEKGKQPTDPLLSGKTFEETKKICQWRNAVAFCKDCTALSAKKLVELLDAPLDDCEKIMKQLEKAGVFKGKSKKSRGVDKERITKLYKAVFLKKTAAEELNTIVQNTENISLAASPAPRSKRSASEVAMSTTLSVKRVLTEVDTNSQFEFMNSQDPEVQAIKRQKVLKTSISSPIAC